MDAMIDLINAGADRLIEKLTEEGLVTVGPVARKLNNSPANVTRLMKDGIKRKGGGRVRLESIRVGGRLMTSWPAVHRFLRAQQEPAPAADVPEVRSPAAATRASHTAESELIEMGA